LEEEKATMAKSNNNYVTNGLSCAIGKKFVFKQFNGDTVVGNYPDRSQVKFSKSNPDFRKFLPRPALMPVIS
jgi:hypothetical protein